MYFSIHNRRLLSGMVAGAVALASASACSRSDRADSQASPSANASAQANTATQPTTGVQSSLTDTSAATSPTSNESASGQNPKAGDRHRRPRSSAARASVANGDQGVSGYKAMAQDSSTASANVDAAQVSAAAPQPSDTSAVASVIDTAVKADTTATVMARDTTDTATIGDTAVILTHADTIQHTEVAVGDSTADAAAVSAGIASTGNIATGADAVALMSRQGKRCVVAASDENRDVLWDMASSPSSLNPCGTGTMTLPRVWTEEKK